MPRACTYRIANFSLGGSACQVSLYSILKEGGSGCAEPLPTFSSRFDWPNSPKRPRRAFAAIVRPRHADNKSVNAVWAKAARRRSQGRTRPGPEVGRDCG